MAAQYTLPPEVPPNSYTEVQLEYGGSSGSHIDHNPPMSASSHAHPQAVKQEPLTEPDTISIDTRSSSGGAVCGCRHVSDDYPKPIPDAPAFPIVALPFHMALQQSMKPENWTQYPTAYMPSDPRAGDTSYGGWQPTPSQSAPSQYQPAWGWETSHAGSTSQPYYDHAHEAPYSAEPPIMRPGTSVYVHYAQRHIRHLQPDTDIPDEEWKRIIAENERGC